MYLQSQVKCYKKPFFLPCAVAHLMQFLPKISAENRNANTILPIFNSWCPSNDISTNI